MRGLYHGLQPGDRPHGLLRSPGRAGFRMDAALTISQSMWGALLFFSSVLVFAVLLSGLARRSVLSTASLFLVAGFLSGPKFLGVFNPSPPGHLVAGVAEIALVVVLFTDGLTLNLRGLRRAWHLPGRALLLGMPLTFGLTVVLGNLVAGLSWTLAALVAAVLSPTDPVFAAAIVGSEEVPWRVRHLLNVESGVNDGIALPVVMLTLQAAGAGSEGLLLPLGQLALGVVLGVAIPLAALWLEASPLFGTSKPYRPLFVLSLGLLVYLVCRATHANEFLGAFSSGITIASRSRTMREAFHGLGEPIAELAKLAAVFLFGALITPGLLADLAWYEWVFVALLLVLARPIALAIALFGTRLTRAERIAVGWFGPRGFASVVYGLYVFNSTIPGHLHLAHLIAAVVATSILAHSSTDVLVAHRLRGIQVEEERRAT